MPVRILFASIATLIFNISFSQEYSNTNDGKFLRSWYIAGPIRVAGDSTRTPDLVSQEDFFNRKDDQKLNVSFSFPGTSASPDLRNWRVVRSATDVIDLDSLFHHTDFASAYAYAVIVSDRERLALLGVGSDDALKVWLNGKLVHKNWIGRGIQVDNDVVEMPLVKGRNDIVLEVQDVEGGWGFTARFLDAKAIGNKLIKFSATGDIEQVKKMIVAGADVNFIGENRQSPLDAAKINGREDVVKLLLAKGAKDTPVPSAEVLVDGLYNKVNDGKNPGIAVLVARDGKIVFEKGYGYADIQHAVKITPQTKFRIGSITKQFTASAILKLQEEGKISVNDKLSKFFPDFPRGDEVTIHQLLTHTSGIHSFTNKDRFLEEVVKPVTNEQVYNYFKNDPYDFNPGEKYQYNNSGYFLLGYIIEKITGSSYGEYLKKTFFDPIGMKNTGVHSPELKLTHEALGYQKQENGYERALNWNMHWAGGAGSLYSTVEDLYKWNEAMFNNRILKPESMKAAFTPVKLNNGQEPPGTKYGYGWGMNDYRKAESISHSGALHGFISQLLRVPDKKITVVLLTNVMPPQVELDAMKVAELYLWQDMPKRASFAKDTVQEKDIEKYTGRYDFSNNMVMTISKEEDGLYAQLSGQPKFPIFQSSPGNYFWKVVEATMHFITDAQGNVTGGHFEQGSFKVDAPKMKDVVYVTADTALFSEYRGTYKYRENVNIVVTSMNGNLYAQATGDVQYRLFPLSATAFHIKELNAVITFKKEASGKVNALHLKFAGDDRDAPKIE